MTPDELAALRKPFPPDQIGKLPKGGQQLDFVGHAYVTNRLLEVDPGWTWEPMGCTSENLPALDQFGNLWINLTICGDTKPGVGDGKSMKECVGDAIRNAAMRFGVALDLWAKGDAPFGLAGHDAPVREQTGPTLKEQVLEAARGSFTSKETFEADFLEQTGKAFATAPQTALSEYLAHLKPFTAPENPPAAQAPAPQGDDTPAPPAGQEPPRSIVSDLRDRALAATKGSELLKLLMEAGKQQVGSEPVADADGNGMTLETFINKRRHEVAAA